MIDLSTEYLGLKLANPLVPSSSPLTGELDSAKQLEDAGASALILPSLFEETIEHEQKQLECVNCLASFEDDWETNNTTII